MGVLAEALSGGGKFVKWAETGQGTVISGTVTNVALRQCLDFDTKTPETWNDGSPKQEAIITLSTAARVDADDDGERNVVVNLWGDQKRALSKACRDVGRAEPLPGDEFAAVWTSGAGGSRDPRVFAYRITPGSGLGSALAADPFAAAQAPAAPAQQAAPAPVPTPAPQPVSAPPAAPAAPAASKPEQVKALAAAGLDIPTIATATGYSEAAVQALITAAF